jgi:hypothetical protein
MASLVARAFSRPDFKYFAGAFHFQNFTARGIRSQINKKCQSVRQSAPRLFIGSLVKHDAAFANLNGLDALAVRFPAKLASSVDNLKLPFRAKHPCPSILYFFRQNSSALEFAPYLWKYQTFLLVFDMER